MLRTRLTAAMLAVTLLAPTASLVPAGGANADMLFEWNHQPADSLR